ncbi:hypothetical protein JCM10213_003164 [Rhodosporidiobolus nylandii]
MSKATSLFSVGEAGVYLSGRLKGAARAQAVAAGRPLLGGAPLGGPLLAGEQPLEAADFTESVWVLYGSGAVGAWAMHLSTTGAGLPAHLHFLVSWLELPTELAIIEFILFPRGNIAHTPMAGRVMRLTADQALHPLLSTAPIHRSDPEDTYNNILRVMVFERHYLGYGAEEDPVGFVVTCSETPLPEGFPLHEHYASVNILSHSRRSQTHAQPKLGTGLLLLFHAVDSAHVALSDEAIDETVAAHTLTLHVLALLAQHSADLRLDAASIRSQRNDIRRHGIPDCVTWVASGGLRETPSLATQAARWLFTHERFTGAARARVRGAPQLEADFREDIARSLLWVENTIKAILPEGSMYHHSAPPEFVPQSRQHR